MDDDSEENFTFIQPPSFQNISRLKRLLGLKGNVSWEQNDDYFIFDDPKLQICLLILYSLVFCFCFIGNLTVVLVTKLHWKMRGVTKFCLGNLAFANLCVSIFCIYQNLSLYLMDSWVFGGLMCKMYHFINSLSHTASIFILVVIAVERYLAILHPFKSRRILTMKRLRFIIIAVWIGSALICSPRLYFIIIIKNLLPSEKGEPRSYEVICSIGSSLFDSRIADWMQFLLLFFLPILIISILYTKIAIALYQRQTFNNRSSRCYSNEHPSITQVSHDLHSLSNESSQTHEVEPEDKNPEIPGSSKELLKMQVKPNRGKKFRRFSQMSSKNPSQNNRSLGSRNDSLIIARRHAGVVRMLVLIVLIFAFCNLPFHLRKLYQHHLYAKKIQVDSIWTDLSAPFTFLLMYVNCALNPFLYAFMSKRFRSCTLDLIRCRLRKTNNISTQNLNNF